MRSSHLILLAAVAVSVPAVAKAADVPVASFNSVELRDGGDVVVRAGATQRVNMIEGDQRHTRFTVRNGKLTIQTCGGPERCPRGEYKLRVEITMPQVTALGVSEGGSLHAEGAFPAQHNIAAAVNQGGMVDARAVSGANVTAAVNEGGRVLVTANASLVAAVNEGGHISYWGHPTSINKAIHGGGAITAGDGGESQGATTPRTVTVHSVVTSDSDDDADDQDEGNDEDADDNDDDSDSDQ